MSDLDFASMFRKHRLEELKAICAFINRATIEEMASIIEEIRCVHDCLYTFNQDTKLFAKVDGVYINDNGIQMNIEKETPC